jgi:AraC family transcriptional regulator, regulatory protein of adaptative response / methylated-DNA-[protein]-cysteine methyltransferase
MKDFAMNAVINPPDSRTDTIRFTLGPFSMDSALVAFSNKGVTAILMGDDRDALICELASVFPHAQLAADEAGLKNVLAKVLDFLEAPLEGINLPLDIRGSAQQRAIWRALRNVPPGQTITYGQIAKALPQPVTAQDVGAACAANVLAVAIPCHRVLKADGSIAGYRWGVQRKRKLIKRATVALATASL